VLEFNLQAFPNHESSRQLLSRLNKEKDAFGSF
jgi:hypothetical protein